MSRTGEHTRAHHEHEWFAAAVERAGVLAAESDDPRRRREVELVGMLRDARAVLAPSAQASARMRAQVMAGAAIMMVAHTEVRVLSAEPSRGSEATPPQRGRARVLPLRGGRGRHRIPATAPAEGTGPRKRGVLTLSAAAALVVLAVIGAATLVGHGAPSADTVSPVTRTTDTVVGRAPSDAHDHPRSLGAGRASSPSPRSLGVDSAAGSQRPAAPTRPPQLGRSGGSSRHHRDTGAVSRHETGSMLAGLPQVAGGSPSVPVAGIPGWSPIPDPSGAVPNLGLSH